MNAILMIFAFVMMAVVTATGLIIFVNGIKTKSNYIVKYRQL